MDVGERDWGMIKQYVDLLTGCKIKLSCARERLTIDVHCFYNKKNRASITGYSAWLECNYGIWKNQVISMVLAQQARGFIQQSMKTNRCCHLGGIFVFGEGKFYFFQRFLIGFFCADNFAFFCCYIVKLPLSCFRIIYQLDFDKT